MIDFASFTQKDVANIALQRTSALVAVPVLGRLSYRLWRKGWPQLLTAETALRRHTILRSAFGHVEHEFSEIESFLGDRKIDCFVDIGCGHALIDLLFWRRYRCSLHLVDIESSDARHHEYREEGAGYASLAAAARFLTRNGVPAEALQTTNPKRAPLVQDDIDVAISLLSCGFHYPAESYRQFLLTSLKPDGVFIFDMRKNSGQEEFLAYFKRIHVIHETTKYKRLAVVR